MARRFSWHPRSQSRALDSLDRREGKVRCECTVENGGFRYAGKLYDSLSGAAVTAAKDLGFSGTRSTVTCSGA
jgi:hypothetical protein